MNTEQLTKLLQDLKDGAVTLEDAVTKLRRLPYEDIGFAQLDHHREIRTGLPEVVFGMGKTMDQIIEITQKLASTSDRVLVTRVNNEVYQRLKIQIPDIRYDNDSQIAYLDRTRTKELLGGVLIVTAGTSDLPVAKEAILTAKIMGSEPELLQDVGVAGIHRLFDRINKLQTAKVIVVIAGMEGALTSVIAGLVSVPVIAVPTSTGYGVSLGGLTALLGMLNSCAPGIAVVNIDNGFGAGYLAGLINKIGRE
ncbi:nickel pincer cofactor biosynthesis protein LarB [SAR202 cluster bacterium AD-802-E10_MRT_200m]|nr:nickel pincer cofactor biosynthesis protein LarB [SAR202 cluster bacterium AD-802-E10_MRT_200m]